MKNEKFSKFVLKKQIILLVHGFIYFVSCFMSQLQYRNKNQKFISNFAFQFIEENFAL